MCKTRALPLSYTRGQRAIATKRKNQRQIVSWSKLGRARNPRFCGAQRHKTREFRVGDDGGSGRRTVVFVGERRVFGAEGGRFEDVEVGVEGAQPAGVEVRDLL